MSTGNYVVEYAYDSWGIILSKTGSLADTLGSINPFRYRGYIYDEETGFYYCQTRYYDPEVGRWLNCDKYASTGIGPLGHNMFVSCNNNPIMLCDPTGDCPRYYDPFTCPLCNHSRMEQGCYPNVEANDPYQVQVDGRMYQKVDEINLTINLSKEDAVSIKKDIVMDAILNELANAAIGGIVSLLPFAEISAYILPQKVIDIYNKADTYISFLNSGRAILDGAEVLIPYEKPYYKCIQVYEDQVNPGHYICYTSIFSANGESYLHSNGFFGPITLTNCICFTNKRM